MAARFTDPKIKNDLKRSYVWFRFDGKLFMFTGGVNRKGLTPSQKAAELKGLQQAWRHSLAVDHFNPITKLYEPAEGSMSTGPKSFRKALEFAREKKGLVWSKKSGQDYDSVIKYILEASDQVKLSDQLIADFKRSHFITILHKVQQNRNLQAKGFNKYRSYLSSLVGELVQWEIVDTNPVSGIKYQPEPKTIAHKPPTEEERNIIMNELKSKYPDLYRFCSVLYGTTIREKEILALQVRDINLKAQTITIIPDRERNNSKTLNEREVVIPDSLMKIFHQLNIYNYPREYFIFSKGLRPGKSRTHPNTPTAQWRKIVKLPKKKGGLAINKDLYGLKKLGGNDMIDIQKEALDLIKMPQRQMGHTTSTMTEIYVTRHKEIANNLLKEGMKEL